MKEGYLILIKEVVDYNLKILEKTYTG